MRDVRESPTHTNPKPKEEQRKKGKKKKKPKHQNTREPKSPKNPPLDVRELACRRASKQEHTMITHDLHRDLQDPQEDKTPSARIMIQESVRQSVSQSVSHSQRPTQ
jgi:hypothetical protein